MSNSLTSETHQHISDLTEFSRTSHACHICDSDDASSCTANDDVLDGHILSRNSRHLGRLFIYPFFAGFKHFLSNGAVAPELRPLWRFHAPGANIKIHGLNRLKSDSIIPPAIPGPRCTIFLYPRTTPSQEFVIDVGPPASKGIGCSSRTAILSRFSRHLLWLFSCIHCISFVVGYG
ncbi:hypothetical protein C8J56DRAFT_911264 [Mycena floridula]|nr:hypothetical protein C8J56DRAFT_936856 [Mycena floridula]KAJ7600780.1 hypothetical protein C8J56DRAFT_911264 [Mycena floridula]